MHHNRIDDVSGQLGLRGRVEALGVADALRLVLEPQQFSWLLEEINELRIALVDARHPQLGGRTSPLVAPSRDIEHDLRVLSRLRREIIVALAAHDMCAVWAPAPLMSELVRGTARNLVDQLHAVVHEHPSRVADRSAELEDLLSATGAWTRTYMALLEIEWFSAEEQAQTRT
jgi:hypothetical protein